MDVFPWVFGTFAAIVLIVMLIIAGFGIGENSLRAQYHQCIELGAPQENCIDKFLGKDMK